MSALSCCLGIASCEIHS